MKKSINYLVNKLLLLFKQVDYVFLELPSRTKSISIPKNTIILIGNAGFYKWAVMECPCGCKEIVNLSLMNSHKPNWGFKIDKWKRLTLSPSIWKTEGCKSHYFVKNGKLIWS